MNIINTRNWKKKLTISSKPAITWGFFHVFYYLSLMASNFLSFSILAFDCRNSLIQLTSNKRFYCLVKNWNVLIVINRYIYINILFLKLRFRWLLFVMYVFFFFFKAAPLYFIFSSGVFFILNFLFLNNFMRLAFGFFLRV